MKKKEKDGKCISDVIGKVEKIRDQSQCNSRSYDMIWTKGGSQRRETYKNESRAKTLILYTILFFTILYFIISLILFSILSYPILYLISLYLILSSLFFTIL